jgi:hypothetical protein
MTRGVQITRLSAAVAISLAACFFAVRYNEVSTIRYQFDHPNAQANMPLTAFLRTYGGCTYAVPLAAMMVGIAVIWRRPSWQVLLEIVVSTLWMLAILWPGLILMIWQMLNIPVFHGMQSHYYY